MSDPSARASPNQIVNDEWDAAIAKKCVSFAQVAGAWFELSAFTATSRRRDLGDDDKRWLHHYQTYYRRLISAFQNTHGALLEAQYHEENQAAIARTSNDEIHLRLPASGSAPEIERLVHRGYVLYIEISRLLTGGERRICIDKVFAILARLLSAMSGATGADSAALADRAAFWRRELREAEEYFARAAKRSAQLLYFQGMLCGLLVLVLAITLTDIAHDPIHSDLHMPDEALVPIVLTLIAGGLGAAVSAMTRMASGALLPDYQVGPAMLRLLGGFRAAIGAVFGLVVYSIVGAGLLPFEMRVTSGLHFYYAVAFLAGFSERWVRDMLLAIERGTTAKVSDGRAARPAAGASQPPGRVEQLAARRRVPGQRAASADDDGEVSTDERQSA